MSHVCSFEGVQIIKNVVYLSYGPVAQLVRAPPCHGGGREFESLLGRFIFGILSQLGEHLPYKQRVIGSSPIGSILGWIPEWPKGADCKSVGTAFEGSNPSPSILKRDNKPQWRNWQTHRT